jgi:hypothetical protein
MPSLRYGLRDQLHFHGAVAGNPDVIITIQRWDAITAGPRRSMCVITHDGTEAMRRFCTDTEDLDRLDTMLATTRAEHTAGILSEDAAADQIARRGGPGPRWCTHTDCGAMIPYAAPQCAEGHPVDKVSAVEWLAVTQRAPVLTAITGGRSRG